LLSICNPYKKYRNFFFQKKLIVNTTETHLTTLKVNGTEYHLELLPWESLLDVLREKIKLTGTKKGCDHGQCGACTVMVDGKRILSCLTLGVMKNESEITTIEGIADGEELHPIQKAFIEYDAFQCGYCTPGQICSAIGMLQEGKANTREEVKELMSGNLCRCGANRGIIDAIMHVKEGGNHE
jgi:xanthine dehydrogenase YagT iron-sulfur-binding subunit